MICFIPTYHGGLPPGLSRLDAANPAVSDTVWRAEQQRQRRQLHDDPAATGEHPIRFGLSKLQRHGENILRNPCIESRPPHPRDMAGSNDRWERDGSRWRKFPRQGCRAREF